MTAWSVSELRLILSCQCTPDNQTSMLSYYSLSLSGMSPAPLHQGVGTSAGWLHWRPAVVLCHTMYPTHVCMTVVWSSLNLRCLNTSLVTEPTFSDVWQWSCLLAIRFTVEVLCLYFCRYIAKWLSANFAFLSATYCGVQWGNHTGGATSCIKYGLTAEVKHSKFHKLGLELPGERTKEGREVSPSDETLGLISIRKELVSDNYHEVSSLSLYFRGPKWACIPKFFPSDTMPPEMPPDVMGYRDSTTLSPSSALNWIILWLLLIPLEWQLFARATKRWLIIEKL